MPDVQLDYKLLTHPDPLQASPKGKNEAPNPATLTLQVSNGTHNPVHVTSILVSLPQGPNAKDLTNDASTIGSTAPEGWSVVGSGGQFTLTPNTPKVGSMGKEGFAFEFTNVTTNDQVGTCEVTITEETTTGSGTKKLPLAKWPPEFFVNELSVDPMPPVSPGTDVALNWNGSDNATYTLKYDETTLPVSHVGPHVVKNLQQNTTFYLGVTAGTGGNAVTLQRNCPVDVLRPKIVPGSFRASPQPVDYGQAVTLAWQSENADSCTLFCDHQQFPLGAIPDANKPYKVTPTVDSSYQLVANLGKLRSNTVALPQISFNPPKVTSFTPSAPVIDYGQTVTLSGEVTSAVSVLINGEPAPGWKPGDTTFSVEKKPTQETTYTLTVHGASLPPVQPETVTVTVKEVSISELNGHIVPPGGGVGVVSTPDNAILAGITLAISTAGTAIEGPKLPADTFGVLCWFKVANATKIRLSLEAEVPCILVGTVKVSMNVDLPPDAESYEFKCPNKLFPLWQAIDGKLTITCDGPGPSGSVFLTKPLATLKR